MTQPRQTVHVQLGERSYDIDIGTDNLSELPEILADRCATQHALVITDANVEPHAVRAGELLARGDVETDLIVVEAGEPSKSAATAAMLWEKFLELGADRKSVVVAVGGGVIGDLAGFAAATFARGLRFVQVPTTLLAQVDSSVGGKTGINLPNAKNMVGEFWQPAAVLIDTALLDSLPDREYRAGLAEVVKYGVILDSDFFEYLEINAVGLNERNAEVLQHAIARSCQLKAEVVEHDERETTGLRAVLNYGHTFCHAFEALTGYGTLLHGEAVAIGMLCASRLAERLGQIDTKITSRQERLLKTLGLPTDVPQLDQTAVIESMRHDKKAERGQLRFILPSRLGHVELVTGVEESDVRAAVSPDNTMSESESPQPPADDSDLRDWLCLSLVSGIGPRMLRQLLDRFETPTAILDAPPSALREIPGVGPKLSRGVAQARAEIDVDAELKICRDNSIRILTTRDDDYPRLLLEIPDPPPTLFVQGELKPADAVAIAIVGSRHATRYGLTQAARLAASLARAGLTVISGLARGIDAAAHRAVLDCGGRTIAVLGGGLLNLYPPEHAALADDIIKQGALISEMPPRFAPTSASFPQRNRIISGLTLGSIIVEAPQRSGALITARHAMEQGREVFAVPGRVDSRASHGCHALIRDGAKLVETAEHVLEELGPLVEAAPQEDGTVVRHPAELQLNETEQLVLQAIESDPILIDAIVAATGLPVPRVLSTLSVLEMRHLIVRTSGNQVARR